MAGRRNQNIPENELGLTIGELTMAVGGILLILLLWNVFNSNKANQQSLNPIESMVTHKIL